MAFTKQVVQTLGLQPKQIYFKYNSEYYPCVIFESSLCEAKIFINIDESTLDMLTSLKTRCFLRFYFIDLSTNIPVAFLAACNVTEYSAYNSTKSEVFLVNVVYINRPPDDLIYRIGSLIETKQYFNLRKEERYKIDDYAIKKMGLGSNFSLVKHDDKLIKMCLRDISLSGCQFLITSNHPLEKGFFCDVNLNFPKYKRDFTIQGKVVRVEQLGESVIIAVSVQFADSEIPLEYSTILNNFAKQRRQDFTKK